MAFIIDKISNITSSTRGNDTIGQWSYCTMDSKATVLTPNYFVQGFTQVRDTDSTFKASEVPLRYIDKFRISDIISVQLVNTSGVQIDHFTIVVNAINYDGVSPSMTAVEFDDSSDVNGPPSSTNNAAVRFDGTTGTLIQNSGVIISDANAVSGVASLNINSTTTVDGVLDDDSMATASATKLATSESIKAYVDAVPVVTKDWVMLGNSSAFIGTSSLDFTGMSSTYRDFLIVLSELQAATVGSDLLIRTSSNGGSTYDSGASDYSMSYNRTENSANVPAAALSSGIRLAINVDATPVNGWIRLHTPDHPILNNFTYLTYHTASRTQTTNFLNSTTGAGFRSSTLDVNAIRILFSTGNFISLGGSITLYGLRA